jgi:5'-deoxynucleotidase YfbR-like HD superfamily hydrolase
MFAFHAGDGGNGSGAGSSVISYTGIHVTRTSGAPNIRDMSVQSMRLCRFAGAYEKHFWPFGMHSLLVADIAADNYPSMLPAIEVHALLHDVASEVVMNDIPRPHKTAEQKAHELVLTMRTYEALGLTLPDEYEKELIHRVDMLAVNAEGALGCGPRGYCQTQTGFKRNKQAEAFLTRYLTDLNPLDLLNADGKWPIHFEKRLRRALRRLHSEELKKSYMEVA